MMFRDVKQTHFPTKPITEEECIKPRSRDNGLKQQRRKQINCSKYRKKVLRTNEHMIIAKNCRHRDDVKHLSRTVSNKINNTENNPINDKYRH